MYKAIDNAKDYVGDALLAGLKGGVGSFFGAVVKGAMYGGGLALVCGAIVQLLSGRWLLSIPVALLVMLVVAGATVYLGLYRAAAGAILAANEEAGLASHALGGVFAVANKADNVTRGIGGDTLDAATSRVAKAAKLLGKERGGVRGLVVDKARKLLFKKVGALATIQLAEDAKAGDGGVDWAKTSNKLEGRIDKMLTGQVLGYLNRSAKIVAVPILAGAILLAIVVGVIGRIAN